MKRILLPLTGFLLIVATGCRPAGTSTAPSTDPEDKNKVRELTVKPPTSQSVRQNESSDLSIAIDRKNFKGPVAIELRNLPKGVEVTTDDLTIPPDKDSLKVTVKANANANVVDDHKVLVAARAKEEKDMKEATKDFPMSVKPKE